DALDPELSLRGARRDRDVVEDAEAHRAVAQGVVAGRAHEREPAPERGLDRRARGERGRLVGRVGRNGVAVEPQPRLEVANAGDVSGLVTQLELRLRREPALA